MRAIDTNLAVRLFVQDDPGQARRVDTVFEAGRVFVSTTVLLETEWVLRSSYRFTRPQLVAALRGLAALPQVEMENPGLVAEALDRAEGGMDFADALHMGSAAGCEAMLTFDRHFIAEAAGTAVPVREP